MKKVKYLIIFISAATIALSGCSKKYIDDIKPSDGSLSDGVIFTSKTGVDNALTGIYYLFQQYVPDDARQNMFGLNRDS